MAILRKKQTDQTGQPSGAEGKKSAGSEFAEAPRRTSKHRAPQQPGQPPQRRARSRSEAPAQQELPLKQSHRVASRSAPDVFSRRLFRFGGAFIGAVVIIFVMFMVYNFMTGSRFFELRHVEVEGAKLVSSEEIEGIVRSVAQGRVLRADLTRMRERLKQNEIIRDVEITRVLPDTIRVIITEREPFALARRSDGAVVCVDREGVMFGDQSLFKTRPLPPLISGLLEQGDRAAEINRQRVMTYDRLRSELDGSQPPLSSRIDEVNFDDVQGVRVILADSRVAVLLGNEDFRVRLNAALDVLDAVKRRDAEALNVLRIGDAEKLLSGAKIAYLNATIPKRVVVGLEE
jgi:cell division septal protein FtsQ